MPIPVVLPRDLQQLKDAPPWGTTAIEGLLTAEGMLLDALRFVPYCTAHRNVWSAHFTEIILEAASQVDSILKATTKIIDPRAPDKLEIKDHRKRFGKLVAKQDAIFFGGASPVVVSPFSEWKGGNKNPEWWTAYNKLKHDRFTHQSRATLGHAVDAVAGLLLAIVYCGQCDLAIMSADLIDTSGYNPWSEATHLRDIPPRMSSIIETKLFAHPLGVGGGGLDKGKVHSSWLTKSLRFNCWWQVNSHKYIKP